MQIIANGNFCHLGKIETLLKRQILQLDGRSLASLLKILDTTPGNTEDGILCKNT